MNFAFAASRSPFTVEGSASDDDEEQVEGSTELLIY